jgi:hypothetical protein
MSMESDSEGIGFAVAGDDRVMPSGFRFGGERMKRGAPAGPPLL